MAKRSPILGYNHNVRYRGLVWHVQTEDSGMANPHLFTHLFHEGVIVSTRKLVYDNGSDEGAIKSLMQAQHKAVMKDLKRGHFDDKIDVYLVGTPGLLPRGGVEEGTGTDAESTKPEPKLAPAELAPAPDDLDPPTYRTDVPLPPPGPKVAVKTGKQLASVDSSAEIRLELGEEEDDGIEELEVEADEPGLDEPPQIDDAGVPLGNEPRRRRRKTHDTEISISDVPGLVIDDATRKNLVDGIPNAFAGGERSHGESIPPLPAPPQGERRPTGERPAVGAATLPAARAITRPPTSRPSITPPTVASRPVAPDPARTRQESDAIEVYSPAPPSVEPPPGVSERPGQYAVHRKSSVPGEILPHRERTGSQPIPSGLGKPRSGATGHPPIARQSSDRIPVVAAPPAIPQPIRQEPSAGTPRPRTPTPARIPSGPSRPNVAGSGGVVMTRPAVIVGAPAKPATPTRVRKAREEEGRGFGQGLISEKSLDEVILAYLSEDADEK